MTLEAAWNDLLAKETGAASHLVEEAPRCRIYASLDEDGDRGITIRFSSSPTLPIPRFACISLDIRNSVDSQFVYLSLFLKNRELLAIFVPICQDLSRTVASGEGGNLADALLRRLGYWRAILDLAPVGVMTPRDLRGLMGEIALISELGSSTKLDLATIINGWNGPLGFSHDFAILGTLLEVKSREPARAFVRISSLEQLENPNSQPLYLVVVDLIQSDIAMPGFDSVSAIISATRESVNFDMALLAELDLRIYKYGYRPATVYESIYFKVDRVRYYEVSEKFPKLVRTSVPAGILAVSYDISLAAAEDFIAANPFSEVGHE